ncbi:MAG TPA: DUF4760 domain-containing protein [Candidatus Angelobacter sp.]
MVEPQTAERAIWWLGETKGFWVQTGALFASAIGALWIVYSRARSERKRATVDLVLHQKMDPEFVKSKQEFIRLRDTQNLAQYISNTDTDQFRTILKILNSHEFAACGIRGRAYHEKLYKRMQCSTVIRDWDALSGFVAEFRRANKHRTADGTGMSFYQDFEWLAIRWKKHPLKPGQYSWWWPWS